MLRRRPDFVKKRAPHPVRWGPRRIRMPVVEVEERIAAPIETVWNLINDVESHPRLMEHVRSVEVRETGPGYRVAAWEADLKGCRMSWVEREEIDAEERRIDYHLVE